MSMWMLKEFLRARSWIEVMDSAKYKHSIPLSVNSQTQTDRDGYGALQFAFNEDVFHKLTGVVS